mgnify:FL=1
MKAASPWVHTGGSRYHRHGPGGALDVLGWVRCEQGLWCAYIRIPAYGPKLLGVSGSMAHAMSAADEYLRAAGWALDVLCALPEGYGYYGPVCDVGLHPDSRMFDPTAKARASRRRCASVPIAGSTWAAHMAARRLAQR